MIEIFLLAAMALALAGSFAAGLWDLKTSDIPDEVVAVMASAGIFIWYIYALTYAAFMLLATSLLLGTAIFFLGWLLYNRGMWGLGDAALFAAIFYLLPDAALLLDYIANAVVVMLAYLIVYTLAAGARTKGCFGDFAKSLAETKKLLPVAIVFAAAAFFAIYTYPVAGASSALLIAVPFLLVFALYARGVEKRAFRKEIPYSGLKEGDVLLESRKWKGLSKAEAEHLRKKKGKVIIKDGVRMGLVFPVTLLLTILYGNVLLEILGFWIFVL